MICSLGPAAPVLWVLNPKAKIMIATAATAIRNRDRVVRLVFIDFLSFKASQMRLEKGAAFAKPAAPRSVSMRRSVAENTSLITTIVKK
jgi:hypothetical protein